VVDERGADAGGSVDLDLASAELDPETEALAREDEDDYDLLTFGEARVRLDQEIRQATQRVRELEAGAPDAQEVDGGAALAAARARLDQLRGAAARNARQPITDENFQRFFGYAGKARRNTE
jgi:hypothetical protein